MDDFQQALQEHRAWCAFDHDCEAAVAELLKEIANV